MTLPVDIGSMRLYSSIRPGLQAGSYQVEMDQEFANPHLAAGVGHPGDMAVGQVVKNFDVTGPRFTLSPTEIHSAFPPHNSVGPFHNQLPHIALKRRTLPWERPGDETNTDLPWLALVILTDGEANFFRNADLEDALPPEVFARVTEQGTCDVLEVTEEIVEKVFPREDELEYLLHVRQVNVNDTENAGNDEDGFMSVVMANRLPQAGHAYGAYLISIEDRFDELPDPNRTDFVDDVGPVRVYEFGDQLMYQASYSGGGGSVPVDLASSDQPTTMRDLEGGQALSRVSAPTARKVGKATITAKSGWHQVESPAVGAEATTTVNRPAFNAGFVINDIDFAAYPVPVNKMRFPVLAFWQFTCTGGLDFRQLMSNLDVKMLGSPPDDGDPDRFPVVADSGHSQIAHTSRGGESGTAWYRSPFTPRAVDRRATGVPFHSADQARTIGGDHIENLAEAAAFEVGRLLALADPSFVQELLLWRRTGFRLLKTASLLDRFGFGGRLTDGLYARDLARTLTRDILVSVGGVGLGPRIDPALGIELFDNDPAVIATGLGTPVRRVRSALGRGGELTTPGDPVDSAPLPEITTFEGLVEAAATELAHLRAGLEDEVEDIARNAVPREHREVFRG
jgi:hypothetical protein